MLWRSLPLLLILKTPYPSAVKTPALSGAAVNLTMMPRAECEKKDYKALETLSPANRGAWFAEHILPEHIRYYSVVSFPCLLYTSPSPRDWTISRMPSSA